LDQLENDDIGGMGGKCGKGGMDEKGIVLSYDIGIRESCTQPTPDVLKGFML